mmetsp:Transcript_81394/g.154503  ORF Transcript_81394/g.154503 Transcript_81394/m.154503 type:complete len:453 (-) Transcript_81394:32-1390(-)
MAARTLTPSRTPSTVSPSPARARQARQRAAGDRQRSARTPEPGKPRPNWSGTPSWALLETQYGDDFLVGGPMPPPPTQGGFGLPGGREWANSFRAKGVDEETTHLAELRARIMEHMEGATPQAISYIVDLVLAQAHEIWRLKRQLEDAGVGDFVSQRVVEAEAEVSAKWRSTAENLAESNAVLEDRSVTLTIKAEDATRNSEQSEMLFNEMSDEARYLGEAAQKYKREAKKLGERVMQCETEAALLREATSEVQELESQLSQEKQNVASEAWSYKLLQSSMKQENDELRKEVMKANEGVAKRMAFERMAAQDVKNAVASGLPTGGGGWFSGANLTLPGAGGLLASGEKSALRDAGALFDAFASAGGVHGEPRMRPADFGHLCESMRRAEGRGATPAEGRRGFAEFAFAAVFGNQALEVDRERFVLLFDHFAGHIQELESAFRHRSKTLMGRA